MYELGIQSVIFAISNRIRGGLLKILGIIGNDLYPDSGTQIGRYVNAAILFGLYWYFFNWMVGLAVSVGFFLFTLVSWGAHMDVGTLPVDHRTTKNTPQAIVYRFIKKFTGGEAVADAVAMYVVGMYSITLWALLGAYAWYAGIHTDYMIAVHYWLGYSVVVMLNYILLSRLLSFTGFKYAGPPVAEPVLGAFTAFAIYLYLV